MKLPNAMNPLPIWNMLKMMNASLSGANWQMITLLNLVAQLSSTTSKTCKECIQREPTPQVESNSNAQQRVFGCTPIFVTYLKAINNLFYLVRDAVGTFQIIFPMRLLTKCKEHSLQELLIMFQHKQCGHINLITWLPCCVQQMVPYLPGVAIPTKIRRINETIKVERSTFAI